MRVVQGCLSALVIQGAVGSVLFALVVPTFATLVLAWFCLCFGWWWWYVTWGADAGP